MIPAGIWEPWAACRTWHFLFSCALEVEFALAGHPRESSDVGIPIYPGTVPRAPHSREGGDFQAVNTTAKPCSFRTGCLARAKRVPSQARHTRWSCLCPPGPSLPPGSAPAAAHGCSHRHSTSPTRPGAAVTRLCVVIFVLLSARASARGSGWQKSVFSHRRKRFQTSVFFRRAVNNAAGSGSHSAGDGGSVTAPGIHVPTEPWLPSGLGAGGWEMPREPGLSTIDLARLAR